MTRDGWREATLGDFAPFTYGKGLRTGDRIQSGSVPVIGSNGIIGYHDTPLTDGPTIVIGRKGTVGAVHFSPVPCWPIDTTFFVTGDDSSLLKFKYYALKSLPLQDMNSDSAVPGLNRNDAHACVMRVPGEAQQRAIAHILGTLDDKIELNRRMNETLEAMARALFKSWFVDFEPVRAKMDGRWHRGESLPGLPAEYYDLFPDRLVPSELGEVPEGWGVGTISQLADRIQNGGTPRRSESNYWDSQDIPWLTSGEVRQSFVLDTQNYISRLGLEHSSAKMIPGRSVLVALYGATAGQVSMNIQPLTTNQAVCAIVPSDGNRYFCLCSLRSQVVELGNSAIGSAQQNISKKLVESISIVMPPLGIRLIFDSTVERLFERMFQNLAESSALAMQRDALLPGLVSGELLMAIAYLTEQREGKWT